MQHIHNKAKFICNFALRITEWIVSDHYSCSTQIIDNNGIISIF